MTFLSRLFGSKPKALTLDQQLAALPQASQAQLLAHLSPNTPEPLQLAAIGLLSYGPELLALAQLPSPHPHQLPARKRLGELLDDGHITLAHISPQVARQVELISLVSYSAKASLEAVSQISSPTLLLELASNAATTHIRQRACEQLTSRSELEQLAKVAQSKDKTVYKLAKTKLDAFKAEDAAFALYRETLSQLCDQMESLAKKDADRLYKGKLLALNNEWQAQAQNAPEDLRQRYQAAHHSAQQQLQARADILAKEEEARQLDEQALAFIHAALHDAKHLIHQLYSHPQIDEAYEHHFQKEWQNLRQAVRLAASRNISAAAQLAHLDQLHHHSQQLLDTLKNTGPLPALITALQDGQNRAQPALQQLLQQAKHFGQDHWPPIVQEAQEALQQFQKHQHHLEEQAKNTLNEISALARKGLWALEQGLARKARGIQKELAEKRQQLSQLPSALSAKLDDFNSKMEQLSDWHAFAVTPKKEDLIQQMQALANSPLNPDDLADKIHHLQDQWKSLSKGTSQNDETLWAQFQQAADTAFAPCKRHFEEQTQLRQSHFDQRQQLINELTTYLNAYNWEQPDWKAVETTLKATRDAWKSYWPVPRKGAQAQQAEFDALQNQISGKMKAAYQSVKDQKRQCIEEARSHAQAEDTQAASEAIKQLQARWKTLGKSWPKDDQALWQQFRTQCDAVFQKRQAQYQEAQQQKDSLIQQAQGYLQQLKEHLSLNPSQLTAAKGQIDALKSQFENLGELPRQAAKSLEREYHQLREALKQGLHSAQKHLHQQHWDDLFNAANLIRQYEQAQLHTETPSAVEAAKAQAEAYLAQLLHWPANSQSLLQQRLQLPLDAWQPQQEANAQQLQQLALRAEILTERETPEAHKAERMAYQVEQLKQGLNLRPSDTLESLSLEWLSLAGVADAPYEAAWARFSACR